MSRLFANMDVSVFCKRMLKAITEVILVQVCYKVLSLQKTRRLEFSTSLHAWPYQEQLPLQLKFEPNVLQIVHFHAKTPLLCKKKKQNKTIQNKNKKTPPPQKKTKKKT